MKFKFFKVLLLITFLSPKCILAQENTDHFSQEIFNTIKSNDTLQFKSLHLSISDLYDYCRLEKIDSSFYEEMEWEYLTINKYCNEFSLKSIRTCCSTKGFNWANAELVESESSEYYSDLGNKYLRLKLVLISDGKQITVGIRKIVILSGSPKILTRLKLID